MSGTVPGLAPETVEWLARALTELREPEVRDRPATVAQDFQAAFGVFGPPTQLVEALNARVFELSRGTMVITQGDPAEFTDPVTRDMRAAFLVLSVRKRFTLVSNPDRPVEFNG